MAAALTLALAGGLVLTGWPGAGLLAVGVGAVQALVLLRWHRSLDVPGALGGMVLAGSAAVLVDVLLVVREDEARPLTPATAVLGAAVVASLLHQLTRRPDRARVTASLTATVTLSVVVVLAALFVAARETRGGADLVAVVALAVAAAGLADLLAGAVPPWVHGPLSVALGAAAGAAVGGLTSIGGLEGLSLGAAAGVTTGVAGALVRRTAHPQVLLAGSLPLAVAGPVAYVLGRILVG